METLKKTKGGSNIIDTNSVLAPPSKRKEAIPVDCDMMLRDIHAKISEIVLTKVNAGAEVTSKEPITLLNVSFSV